MLQQILTPRQKALTINLNTSVYGTFAEIGAGQETVRYFFRAGGASGTIAKAMSAYDKDFSDAVYGKEETNRYVTESRLRKMLRYEASLVEERLVGEKKLNKKFFSYANTVTTISYDKTTKGHGWVGIRFQMKENEPYNEIVLHVRFKENDATQQQETLGSLGVNLIYGAFYHSDDPRKLIQSLYDDIAVDKIEIDMIDFSGPEFAYVDNRLMSLQLIKRRMTNAVIFNSQGNNMLPADVLHKRNIFVVRGSFRPVTLVNIDMFEKGLAMFISGAQMERDDVEILFEITLTNLLSFGDVDERDFLDRVDVLAKLGYKIIISDFSEYYRVVDYFSTYTNKKIGIAMGVNSLLNIFDEKYYTDLSGGILEAFGKLFKQGISLYLYPYKDPHSGKLLNSDNLEVRPNLKELYKYFKLNKRIVDIEDYNSSYSGIYSRDVLRNITTQQPDWEKKLPDGVAEMIKERGMFGYKDICTDGIKA